MLALSIVALRRRPGDVLAAQDGDRGPSRSLLRAMPQGDIFGLAPTLCLTREQADIVFSKSAYAVRSVFANL
ncbi:MAG: hypothetical protein EOS46_18785 [Mesorhizobium sp.]|nr:hypothetical protein EOD14_00610 [Mesorhizobium sp. M7A.T.Ca.US.000.02.1.1]RUT94686.1 hypothetical protein EOD15_00620 [Mesorhizobium sp. M7A.T.Ca.US.000.02.2.1]RUU06256.1 hypothetical protein EOD12_00250 [Mesorhizobium sp. M7A.T.Ca.TU.009.02.1.1]RUU62538.1 hypothetical protein EOC99_17700 [Mesorhizobium sp. M7A.T.Ca.TU.009.01.1.1]RUU89732.1 hypothetical protein EOD03_02735 [Mesorhizobium sp. M7A.T.Ca.TU.009.01.1.2]RUW77668.1 hypothetical protein EOA31_03935 [Mesorhizobium sp. M4B.F.Ca.ET.0